MTNTNSPSASPPRWTSLIKTMSVGAAIGFTLISLFLLGDEDPDPSWGKYYMVRPLIIVPLAGAMGGAFYYIMDHLRNLLGWNRTFTILLSLLVFIIGLWLGSVLGLDGTYWN